MTNLGQRLGLIPSPSFELQPNGKVKVTNTSVFTRVERSIVLPITMEQVERWRQGELVQNAFPSLDAGQREFLLTGAWDDEWDTFVPPDEEE
jgi:hypothetical protein